MDEKIQNCINVLFVTEEVNSSVTFGVGLDHSLSNPSFSDITFL